MDAPELDPELRLALLLIWALHDEAERLTREREEAPSPTRR